MDHISPGLSTSRPLSALQVVAVRYRGVTPAEDDERALDAYAESGVYGQANVSFTVVEPQVPASVEADPSAADAHRARERNLGLFNGIIADEVARARGKNKAILMTGGDCTHLTGVVGGLQDAHGPAARIGLVWFDAHGDFNTPYTTLTGSMGGMPVAVCAGLAFAEWRECAHIAAPLPCDRIVMVDVRNLDPAEEELIRALGIPTAAVAPDFPGTDLQKAVSALAMRCDMLYLHIDADILDVSYVPDHSTGEPNGPDMAQVLAAIDIVMATGKVVAFAVVSVYAGGPERAHSVDSGIALVRGGLEAWRRGGTP